MAKNFHNGTNIIAKHDTIFLGEKILEFFVAPTVKDTLASWGIHTTNNRKAKLFLDKQSTNIAVQGRVEQHTIIWPNGIKGKCTSAQQIFNTF